MGRLSVVALLATLQSSGGLHRHALVAEGPGHDRPRAVAWLISGQVSRFIYRDSARFIDGGIRAWSGCNDYKTEPAGCPISVDVHIALSNTHVSGFRGAKYDLPAYEDGAFEEPAIAAHYNTWRVKDRMLQHVISVKNEFTNSGAREVRVRIVGADQFDEDIKAVRQEILAKAKAMSNKEPEAFDTFWRKLPGHENRFEQNGNMMYLRHLAYSSAVEAEKSLPYKYTHVLYTREDNVFVHPSYTLLQLARDMDNGAEPLASPASVLVDKHCGWLYYSDKLYFASRRGIDVLFARTRAEHISQMAQWINMAPTATKNSDPLMTEEYFKRLLEGAHANVTKFEFGRFEARYVNGSSEPCIPDLYRKCTEVPMFDTCPKKFAGYR
jgi:hypothetical protein